MGIELSVNRDGREFLVQEGEKLKACFEEIKQVLAEPFKFNSRDGLGKCRFILGTDKAQEIVEKHFGTKSHVRFTKEFREIIMERIYPNFHFFEMKHDEELGYALWATRVLDDAGGGNYTLGFTTEVIEEIKYYIDAEIKSIDDALTDEPVSISEARKARRA
jgi:hypothetical protein